MYFSKHTFYVFFFFFSSRRRHTRWTGDWSSDVCSSDLDQIVAESHGNPLALLELPRTWKAAELAGGYGIPGSQREIGRASCRERGESWGGGGAVKKKRKKSRHRAWDEM